MTHIMHGCVLSSAWRREGIYCTVDSRKLEYGPRMIYAGFPHSLGFGLGGQSYCNFLAATVPGLGSTYQVMVHSLCFSLGHVSYDQNSGVRIPYHPDIIPFSSALTKAHVGGSGMFRARVPAFETGE